MVNVSFSQALQALVELGRQYLERPTAGSDIEKLASRCRDLVSLLGEASGTALASEIVDRYLDLPSDRRLEALARLDRDFAPDAAGISDAARKFLSSPTQESYRDLAIAMETPRLELFRRLNMAPGGTAAIVNMRRLLLPRMRGTPELQGLEYDLKHLLSSWFNRGFLQFERIDWRTPAIVLEKLIAYEAVHEIGGWDDLRRRLAEDRRCFAFFHPALPDEPLIFVEVALTHGLAVRIHDLIEAPFDGAADDKPGTAIFYSISNCQEGLAGISFGNFLIKQVVDALQTELPHVAQFATLSPVPGFRNWLDGLAGEDLPHQILEDARKVPDGGDWCGDDAARERLRPILTRLCATYLLTAKHGNRPADPVARFHLGNGASIERINWEADLSTRGIEQSFGIMVNYLYDPGRIVSNHEAFAVDGRIAASSAVSRLAADHHVR